MQIYYFFISLLASTVGAICGIGGGVVIKPVLDLFRVDTVATISFLSGCTVLAMSCYSVGRNMLSGQSRIEIKTASFLAAGAVAGGILGNRLFAFINGIYGSIAGAAQSGCLFLLTFGTLVYMLNKQKVKTMSVKNPFLIVAIGFLLGGLSSFLGIGGGPMNLVVLAFFFGMDTKTAAQNSLYIILFSQISSLTCSFVLQTVPSELNFFSLGVMITGGILGGVLGRMFNKKLSTSSVDKLFNALLTLIMAICVWNSFRYLR